MNLKSCLIVLSSILICASAYAEPYEQVQIAPMERGVSVSTVTFDGTSWVTMPTVALAGRHEVSILNTSSSENVYLSNIWESTTTMTLYPRQRVTLGIASYVNLFATANTAGVKVEIIEVR